ncbi:RNA polymerase sigma factor [Spirosoma areae]
MENAQESIKSLFQQEFAKLVAVISKRFGLQHIELAEDIVSETFLLAAETWGVRGLPANPTAWLYTVAKQKTLYQFKRRNLLNDKIIPELAARLRNEDEWDEPGFSAQTIRDSQLQMLFAICTPLIADEAQIGLALRILCGFGIDEIADAFLSNKETINKRLFRAKEKLRAANITMELPSEAELVRRLDRVLHVIYLLFNEGYQSRTHNRPLQKDVCLEAMRLAIMLTEYDRTNQPKTNALLALMCFHASRFEARTLQSRTGGSGTGGSGTIRRFGGSARRTGDDSLVLYEQQNDALWDTALIRQGFAYLERSLQGDQLSAYHLEARIASWHCVKEDTPEKWAAILHLYDQLLVINQSPSVALNRTYALYKVSGRAAALAAVKTLRLDTNHLYFMLLGELYRETDPVQATINFWQAYELAKTATDRQLIQRKLEELG